MGLFDGKEKKEKQESAENEVRQKLSACPLLDLLIENVLGEEDEPWLQMGQSYYDDCSRTVKVVPDGFEIKWSSYHYEPYIGSDGQSHEQKVEDVNGRVGYSFTKRGYRPLHSYSYDDGKKNVSTERVCYVCASIIRERMAAKMPNCKFDSVNWNATFTYTVPALTFKDWF